MINRRTFVSAVGAVAVTAACPAVTFAASTMPFGKGSQPVRIVVPYSPGGPLDVSARAIADAVTEKLGTVVVDNRPGAGGGVGMAYVARRPADGMTIVMGAVATLAINPHLYSKLSYDAKKDFRPVTLVAIAPNVLVITPEFSAKTGVKTLKDLIAYAKANPGKLNYASGGNGSAGHMAGELLKNRSGIQMEHIPFAGASPALLSVLSGQTDLIFDNLASSTANIRAGKLIPLAVTTKERTPLMPEIPTMAEAGVKDFDIYTWYGFVVPSATPDDVVDYLNEAVTSVLKDPAMQKRFVGFGAVASPNTPKEFAAMIEDEYNKYEGLVKLSGARVD